MSGKDTSVLPLPEETSRSFFSHLDYLESLQHSDTDINFQITGKGGVDSATPTTTVQINVVLYWEPDLRAEPGKYSTQSMSFTEKILNLFNIY